MTTTTTTSSLGAIANMTDTTTTTTPSPPSLSSNPPKTDPWSGLVPEPKFSDDLDKEEQILHKELVLFGTDVGSVPCFRNSFLYGIGGGMGSGIVHFALSSKVKSATSFGFYSYVAITLTYWIGCRYSYSATKFKYTQLKHAMRQKVLGEGTKDDIDSKSS